ncbi:MAG: EAL domain-containing protein (putative c-di-GMP-specific phosphodiesterase class I) [Gammaproteobacteria bacterium]|jgi:EAL domain-containing protein (putative c-di-GMP-specific phosphodiesterase class I)/FixJ family two-component response regulator
MSDEQTLKRILIFDDDADMRKLLLVYLSKLFPGVDLEEYDPLTSGEPDEDFDWSRIDVLILDYFICIHGVTGLDILHNNRKNPEFPATIMLTGAGNEEVAVRSLKAGVYDYLRKQSLDKQQLHDSIVKAFKLQGETEVRKQESTQQGKAFNKSLFYQQIEFHKDLPEYRDRVLLLIKLDNHGNIAEREGVILRDNIIRHIAKESFEIFNLGNCHPSVTRLSDAAIALLIDTPDSRKTLEFNTQGLLNHLSKRPYNYNDKKIKFTISVGVIQLYGEGEAREIVIGKVKNACNTASNIEGNSYYIHEADTDTIDHQKTIPALTKFEQKSEMSEAKISSKSTKEHDLDSAPVKTDTTEKAKEETDESTTKNNSDIELTPVISETINEGSAQPLEETPSTLKPEQATFTAPEIELDFELTPINQEPPEPVPVTPPPPTPKPVKAKAPEPVARTVAQAKVSIPSESMQIPAEARPKKSLEVLKAEMEKAKQVENDTNTIEKEAETVSEPDHESSKENHVSVKEVELDVSTMSDSAKSLKKAFEEQRIVQAYQPIISLLNDEMDNDDEMHSISLIQIEEDGTLKSDDEIRSHLSTAEFQKFVDHWLLREVIGMLANKQKTTDTFIIKLSDVSLSNAGFFNWLRKLLTGLDAFNPGKYIVLQIDSKDLSSLEKQAGALISYLRKSHEFKFILGNVTNIDDIIRYAARIQFDLIRCNTDIIKELQNMTIDANISAENTNETPTSQLDLIKSNGTRFIADNIENATALTEAIGLGVEFAMGDFIGEPLTQLEDSSNIESFEIT